MNYFTILALISTTRVGERGNLYMREIGTCTGCSMEKDRKCDTSECILPGVGMNIRY
jgi:hypothetical protein